MIRHPEIDEQIPFRTGFEPLDPEWTWVAEIDGEIQGIFVGAKFHSVMMLCRLMIADSAGKFVAMCLVKAAFREARQRGLGRAMVFLGEGEGKIEAITRKHGARIIPTKGTWVADDLDKYSRPILN